MAGQIRSVILDLSKMSFVILMKKGYYKYMYYVYALRLNDSSLYTGYSTNLKERMKMHNKGGVNSTKLKRPVELVWYCAFKEEEKAIKLEKYLKTASGIAIRNKHFI